MKFVGSKKLGVDADRDLSKASSQPLQLNSNAALLNGTPQHLQDRNQSNSNLEAVPLVNSYHHIPSRPQPLGQPYVKRQVIHQRSWASTTNLPATSSPYCTGNDVSIKNTPDDLRGFVGDRLSELISMIDEDAYPTSEKDVVIAIPETSPPTYAQNFASPSSHVSGNERSIMPYARPPRPGQQTQTRNINILTKLSYYSNSRLPASLPPFRAYISTYPLLCLAALCSSNAYSGGPHASKDERLISANTRIGTKAMIIKSVTCNEDKTIVIAIRGTSILSLRDWNVNFNTTPESPVGFLDDEGNYCHSGFLSVAKAMIKPTASHLRHLLEENPNRLSYSLLITGHSAGGAIASLLYTHMFSERVRSELTILADCFKRVHCVTFGAPPITLLPLRKPASKEHKLQKSLFHSFINEGDPVVRAEKSYVLSLVDLLTTTPSTSSLLPNVSSDLSIANSSLTSMSKLRITNLGICTNNKKQKAHTIPARADKLTWTVPPSTLSNAGRLVVLRGPEPPPKASMSQIDLTKEFEEVRAFTATDEEIRKVIFGDPLMHAMDVYRRRIEALAMKAVTGRDKFY